MALWRSGVRLPSGPATQGKRRKVKGKMDTKLEGPKHEKIARKFIVQRGDLADRTVNYALLITQVYQKLAKTEIGKLLAGQLLRSGTSVGANYHESQGAQSKADFISKISIAHKEALETLYWLRVIKKEASLSTALDREVVDETEELIKIFSTILLKSKNNT